MARRRVFEVDEAIDIATDLFWRQGYDRTSVSDLTEAMGITPPSFYHAFGSKEALFEAVLKRYLTGPLGFIDKALAQPTALAVAEHFLRGYADTFIDPAHPGCLSVNSALPIGGEKDYVRNLLFDARRAMRKRLQTRLEAAKASGDLPTDANVDDLARFIQVVYYGLSIEAQSGASRKDLHRSVDLALRAWPHIAPKRSRPVLKGTRDRRRGPKSTG
jgi:AcrR family transcriptional regulator